MTLLLVYVISLTFAFLSFLMIAAKHTHDTGQRPFHVAMALAVSFIGLLFLWSLVLLVWLL